MKSPFIRSVAGLSALTAAALTPSLSAQTAAPAAPVAESVFELPDFKVSADKDVGYRAGNSVSATRVDTAIKDLPFSISAFTEQFISDISALELTDIVSYAPGVTSGAKEFTQGNNRYSIRGFDGDTTPQRNGFIGGRYVDSSNIQRVEVVKGPASLLYGQITPGGSVNYITKRPTEKNFVRLKQQVGTDSFWRSEFDTNRVLNSRVSTRLVGAYENSFAWANPSGGNAKLIAGAVEVKLHDRITLIVDFENYWRNQEPLVGMSPNMSVNVGATTANFARVADRARAQAYVDVGNLNLGFIGYPPLPRDFNYVGSGDYRKSNFDTVTAEVNVKLFNSWRARANFGWNRFKISNKLTGLAEFTITPATAYLATKNRFDYVAELQQNPGAVLADPTKTASALMTRRKRLEQAGGDSRSYQFELAGVQELWGVKLKPLFGASLSNIGTESFRRESTTNPPAGTPNNQTTPIQHFQPWNYNDRSTWIWDAPYDVNLIPNVNSFNDTRGEESALYGLLNASFLKDRVILIGGARWNETWSQNTDMRPTVSVPAGPATKGDKYKAQKTTPQFGGGVKVTREVMLFGSYSESFFVEDRSLTSFNPNFDPTKPVGTGNRVTESTPAKPTTGEGYEFGLKTDLFAGRVSSTISWFHLERANRVLRFREVGPDGSFPTITRQGTVDQSEGVEAEVTWSPIDNFQVYAGFSKMDIRTIKATFPAIIQNSDPVYQAAYNAAFEEAKNLVLNAVPEGSAETLASLWSRYTFTSGPLKNLWVAGGFVYTGDKAQRTANPRLFLESSLIWDASLGYEWKTKFGNWSTGLSVKNLTDKDYYNANQSRGTPRRFIVSVSTKF